jgi:hypothetical protein
MTILTLPERSITTSGDSDTVEVAQPMQFGQPSCHGLCHTPPPFESARHYSMAFHCSVAIPCDKALVRTMP